MMICPECGSLLREGANLNEGYCPECDIEYEYGEKG